LIHNLRVGIPNGIPRKLAPSGASRELTPNIPSAPRLAQVPDALSLYEGSAWSRPVAIVILAVARL
jgi:hypothetical protein